jgi:Fur family transcriptional regulator, stress-responsive regulator
MDAARQLRTHGLRVTRPRVAALEVLSAGGHLTVDEVRVAVGQRIGAVSVQAMYDVLGALSEARLVRRIEPAGSPTRYEARAGDNHHHLVCRGCGRVVDVDCVVGDPPCMQPADSADTLGFTVDEAEVTFWGRCRDCQPA